MIWDEQLNYLDTSSREQLEEVKLEYKPTIFLRNMIKPSLKILLRK